MITHYHGQKYRDEQDQELTIRDFGKWCSIGLILWAVILLALYSCAAKADASILAEVGRTYWQQPAEKLWVQYNNPHEMDLESGYVRLGIIQPVTSWLDVGLSAYSLGRYSILAYATADEDCYNAYGNSPKCGFLERYETSGSIYGAALTATLKWKALFLEAGPTYYRQSFKLSITNETYTHCNYQESLWGPGYMIGIGAQGKEWRASLNTYNGNVGGGFHKQDYPSGMGLVHVVALGYRF